MSETIALWEDAGLDAPVTEPGQVQARAFISKESSEWAKVKARELKQTHADYLGALLEEAIAEAKSQVDEQLKRQLIEQFGPDFKTKLKGFFE